MAPALFERFAYSWARWYNCCTTTFYVSPGVAQKGQSFKLTGMNLKLQLLHAHRLRLLEPSILQLQRHQFLDGLLCDCRCDCRLSGWRNSLGWTLACWRVVERIVGERARCRYRCCRRCCIIRLVVRIRSSGCYDARYRDVPFWGTGTRALGLLVHGGRGEVLVTEKEGVMGLKATRLGACSLAVISDVFKMTGPDLCSLSSLPLTYPHHLFKYSTTTDHHDPYSSGSISARGETDCEIADRRVSCREAGDRWARPTRTAIPHRTRRKGAAWVWKRREGSRMSHWCASPRPCLLSVSSSLPFQQPTSPTNRSYPWAASPTQGSTMATLRSFHLKLTTLYTSDHKTARSSPWSWAWGGTRSTRTRSWLRWVRQSRLHNGCHPTHAYTHPLGDPYHARVW